jgi:hypothetical protein
MVARSKRVSLRLWLGLLAFVLAPSLGACTAESGDVLAETSEAALTEQYARFDEAYVRAKEAHEAVQASDERLAQELGFVAPLLSADESQGFVRAYESQSRVQQLRKARLESLRELLLRTVEPIEVRDAGGAKELKPAIGATAAMGRVGGAIESRGLGSVPQRVYRAYAMLANSAEGAVHALYFADHVLAGDRTPILREGTRYELDYRILAERATGLSGEAAVDQVIREILVPALVQRTLAIWGARDLASAMGAPRKEDVESILSPAVKLRARLASLTVSATMDAIAKVLNAKGPALSESAKKLQWLVTTDPTTGFGRAVLVVSVMGGMMRASDAWQQEDHRKAVMAIAGVSPDIALVLAQVAQVSKSSLALGTRLAGAATKLTPFVGVALMAVTTYDDWRNFNPETHVASSLALAGDIIALGGFVAALFPPAAVAAAITVAVGTAIKLVADFVKAAETRAAMFADLRAHRATLNLDETTLARLEAASDQSLGFLATDLRLGRDDLRAVLAQYPVLLQAGIEAFAFEKLVTIYDLDSAQSRALLQAVANTQPAAQEQALQGFYVGFRNRLADDYLRIAPRREFSRADLDTALAAEAQRRDLPATYRSAVAAADAFVHGSR